MSSIDSEACNPSKLGYNGGYNCTGSGTFLSCRLKCPAPATFSFPPASEYTCNYSYGFFLPNTVPACQYGK